MVICSDRLTQKELAGPVALNPEVWASEAGWGFGWDGIMSISNRHTGHGYSTEAQMNMCEL